MKSFQTSPLSRIDVLPAALLLFVLGTALFPVEAVAQDAGSASAGPIGPTRADRPEINVDGRIDEPAWSSAWTLPALTQVVPDEGGSPTETTELRMIYDGQAVYLAGHLREKDLAAIVDRDFGRDGFDRTSQDGLALILDTDADPRTGYGFIVTPSGGRTDIAISERQGDPIWNLDWNAFWTASTAKTADGWDVEMRIPFSSLRFETDAAGRVTMGILVWRYRARTGEFDAYPRVPNNWHNSAYKVARAASTSFTGIEARRPLYVKPYLLGGTDIKHRLNDDENAYVGTTRRIHSFGVDAKYNLTSNLVLDLTENTDFAQVEADDQVLNLDRFSLFFPEKRDFFQERADLFEFSIPGAQDRIFHSRTIGIVDGQPVPIRAGGRITGHYRGLDLGVVSMQTGSSRINDREVPSENFGTVRVRRPLGATGSYAGAILTTRTNFRGDDNVVIGIDGDTHVIGDYYLDSKVAMSAGPGPFSVRSLLASGYLQRRIVRGFLLATSYRYVGRDFNAGLGFMQRTGYQRVAHRTQYAWFPTHGPIQNHDLSHLVQIVWDEHFRAQQTHFERLSWNFRFRNSASASAEVNFTRDVVDKPFRVGTLSMPVGTFDFPGAILKFSSPSGRPIEAGGSLEAAGYYGGSHQSGSLKLTWSAGSLLSLGSEGAYDRIRVPSGNYDAVITRVRVGTAPLRSLNVNAYLQHNSALHVFSPNVRIRYNAREGSDLYVVYNENLNTWTGEAGALPRLPRSQARSLQVKYTYTFMY